MSRKIAAPVSRSPTRYGVRRRHNHGSRATPEGGIRPHHARDRCAVGTIVPGGRRSPARTSSGTSSDNDNRHCKSPGRADAKNRAAGGTVVQRSDAANRRKLEWLMEPPPPSPRRARTRPPASGPAPSPTPRTIDLGDATAVATDDLVASTITTGDPAAAAYHLAAGPGDGTSTTAVHPRRDRAGDHH